MDDYDVDGWLEAAYEDRYDDPFDLGLADPTGIDCYEAYAGSDELS